MCHEKLYLSKKISQTGPEVPAQEEEELEIVDTEDDNDDSDVTVDSVTDSDE